MTYNDGYRIMGNCKIAQQVRDGNWEIGREIGGVAEVEAQWGDVREGGSAQGGREGGCHWWG